MVLLEQRACIIDAESCECMSFTLYTLTFVIISFFPSYKYEPFTQPAVEYMSNKY